MKTILLAPDSFKGTLTAAEICHIETQVIHRHLPQAEVHALPMADGGEGMVDAYLLAIGGEKREVSVSGPFGQPVRAFYGVLPDGCAVLEMAAAAGLSLAEGRNDLLHASTRGVGELLLDAVRHGHRKILLGLGGSCTNDCGIGMAAVLGFRFLDENGADVAPLAINLERIAQIEAPAQLPEIELTAACDVNNPLIGKDGATYTFGPQKGADPETLQTLERGMASFSKVLARYSGLPVADVPGGGAAGGLGAAVLRLLGGTLKSGIETLLDAAQFDALAAKADLVITGEGRIDWQSAHGKVPMGVGLRCKQAGVPCIALCGSVGENAQAVYACGITAIFSAVQGVAPLEEVLSHGRENLEFLTDSVMRLLCSTKQGHL